MNDRRADTSSTRSDVRELLVRRAERLRKPAADDERDDDALWVAAFSLGGEEYAIALPSLRAAVPLRRVTSVPGASRLVVGVFQFGGEVIAVLSTASLLASGWSVDPTILLVVDTGHGHTVALDCAQIPVAMTLPSAQYRQARSIASGALSCVAVPGRGVVNVVDVARLLKEQDWGPSHGDC